MSFSGNVKLVRSQQLYTQIDREDPQEAGAKVGRANGLSLRINALGNAPGPTEVQ